MSKPSYLHDFLYSYGRDVGNIKPTKLEISTEGVEKIMADIYKMVEYKEALESYFEITRQIKDGERDVIALNQIENLIEEALEK